MGKEEIKAVQDILSSKKKFKRAVIVMLIICATLTAIAGIGFYTGAITYHNATGAKNE